MSERIELIPQLALGLVPAPVMGPHPAAAGASTWRKEVGIVRSRTTVTADAAPMRFEMHDTHRHKATISDRAQANSTATAGCRRPMAPLHPLQNHVRSPLKARTDPGGGQEGSGGTERRREKEQTARRRVIPSQKADLNGSERNERVTWSTHELIGHSPLNSLCALW